MYNAYVTKLKNVRKHPNADRLQLAECFENTVVIGLDAKEGDVVLYFPTDGQLGVEYAEKNNLLRKKDENGNNIGGYIDPDKRNVKAMRLRGEKSDGLTMSLNSLEGFTDTSLLSVGDTISVLNGVVICSKYIPTQNIRSNGNKNLSSKIKVNSYPFFEQHIDTQHLQYNLDEFKVGDICTISAKLHGTSMRFSNSIKTTELKRNIFQKIFKRPKKVIKEWSPVSGSRRVILDNFDGGFYGDNEFRKKYHDLLSKRVPKGLTIYGEIVGYLDSGATIMAPGDNKKTQDKEFIKKYGDTTYFSYGCEIGENHLYVYRITMTNEDGYVVEIPTWAAKSICVYLEVDFVPILDQFIFTTKEDLLERANKWLDIPDVIGKTHVSEGVVVRIENRKTFAAFKHKSFNFKVLEGIIKESALAPDIEEVQEIENEG